ncbi:threonine/serine exporter family protein [Collinsella vaginalis]|uniref:threonine/serine exporter family protein n=1 Tax=Collinsella vaginalis TaxID=1870987 RepID=UPI000A26CCF3|nr:threonine/serine exporter family protein [Collinsella vaginalis]
MVENLILIALSFAASLAFGIGFQIRREDLVIAGIGGAVVRTVSIILTALISSHFVIVGISALAAGLFGGVLARRRRAPSAYFVYPSLTPLIPGDLFHYALAAILVRDMDSFTRNGLDCMMSLLAMAIGLLVGSAISAAARGKTSCRIDERMGGRTR